MCVCGKLFGKFNYNDHWLTQQLREGNSYPDNLLSKSGSLILKLMTNERNPSSRVSEKRLRFIITQEKDRREEPHPGCIISICIKRPRLSCQTDTELPCQDSSSY